MNIFKPWRIYWNDLSDSFHFKADGTVSRIGRKTVLGAFYFSFPGEADLKEKPILLNCDGKQNKYRCLNSSVKEIESQNLKNSKRPLKVSADTSWQTVTHMYRPTLTNEHNIYTRHVQWLGAHCFLRSPIPFCTVKCFLICSWNGLRYNVHPRILVLPFKTIPQFLFYNWFPRQHISSLRQSTCFVNSFSGSFSVILTYRIWCGFVKVLPEKTCYNWKAFPKTKAPWKTDSKITPLISAAWNSTIVQCPWVWMRAVSFF